MRARDRIALVLIAIVLIAAPFMLGGAPRWAICLTSALSACCALSFVTSRRELGAPSPLLAFVAVAAAITFLQVVPLPSAVVAFLSPAKHQLLRDNAAAMGKSPPSWSSLSLDPPSTLRELAKLCGYVAFVYAALRIVVAPARRRWLLSVVALVGALMAVTALLHGLLDADKVFGLYRPKQALSRPTLAPLMNHNHLSALMALSSCVALGLALSSTERLRLAWIGVVALCAAVCLLAESRGGALALVLGLVTVGALVLFQRRGPPSAAKTRLPDKIAIAVLSMSLLALVVVFTAGGVLRDLSSTRMAEVSDSRSRFAAWRSSSELLQEFPLTGIGRGSFEMASTRVHDSREEIYPHVENEYLQAAVDWGIVGAAALALIFVWLGITAIRRGRTDRMEAGALGGLVALAIENFTDFSLWMPGVAYPALATAAALTWVNQSENVAERRTLIGLRCVGSLAVVVAVILAASPLGRDVWTEIDDANEPRADRSAVNRAEHIFERHPSSYAAAGLLGQALFRARDHRAVSIVNRGLALNPTSGELYLVVGRILLASQHREQARTAFASALQYRPKREVLDEILAAFPADEDAVRALPIVPAMVQEWADQLRQRGRVPLALAYLKRYLALYPDDNRIQLHAAAAAIDAGDFAMAVRAAQAAHALDPSTAATITYARALLRQNNTAVAGELLRSQMERPSLKHAERVDLHLMNAEVLVAEGQDDAARQTLHEVMDLAEGQQLARVHTKLAEIEEHLGNKHQAAWERERATQVDR